MGYMQRLLQLKYPTHAAQITLSRAQVCHGQINHSFFLHFGNQQQTFSVSFSFVLTTDVSTNKRQNKEML